MAVRLLKEGAMGQARIQPLVMAEPLRAPSPVSLRLWPPCTIPVCPRVPRPTGSLHRKRTAMFLRIPILRNREECFENGFHQGEKGGHGDRRQKGGSPDAAAMAIPSSNWGAPSRQSMGRWNEKL